MWTVQKPMWKTIKRRRENIFVVIAKCQRSTPSKRMLHELRSEPKYRHHLVELS